MLSRQMLCLCTDFVHAVSLTLTAGRIFIFCSPNNCLCTVYTVHAISLSVGFAPVSCPESLHSMAVMLHCRKWLLLYVLTEVAAC